jgi:hypothetical protein
MQKQNISDEEEPLQGKILETIQRLELEEEKKLQMKPAVQRQEIPKEEELLQRKMIGTVQRQEIPEEEEPLQTKKENNTGMPDNLKAGVETLSGIDISDVRVHYNSLKPAEVGALAYTQGINIHVAPGQERYLPHEAWHVVQQMQGQVKPTMQMKGSANVNDDKGLEKEADAMGAKAIHHVTKSNQIAPITQKEVNGTKIVQAVIQRVIAKDRLNVAGEDHDKSEKRRDKERNFTKDQTGGEYWTESEFLVSITTDEGVSGEVSADPVLLQWFNGVHFLAYFIEEFRKNYLSLYTPSSEWELATFKIKLNRVSNTTQNLLDFFMDLKKKSANERLLINQQNNISNIEIILGQQKIIEKITEADKSVRDKAGKTGDALKKSDPSNYRDIVKRECKVIDELQILITEVDKLKEVATFKLELPQLSFMRSFYMTSAAQENSNKLGIWKIGEAHIKHMEGMADKRFNWLTKDEFNVLFRQWENRLPSFEEQRWAHYNSNQ